MSGTLYVVATPIGNLEDVTLRALRVLREASIIAAEDTRRTARLLQHYSISTPTTSLHEHNERAKAPALVQRLLAGDSVALVTDAGTPGISDPGAKLVGLAREAGVRVEPVPGPSAALAALSASGFAVEEFLFLGFPPSRSNAKDKWLRRVSDEARVLILYEAPHRIVDTLRQALEILGDRRVLLAREITKTHEELVERPISGHLAAITDPRGEYTLVIEGAKAYPAETPAPPEPARVVADFGELTNNRELSRRDAVKQLAKHYSMPARDVYRLIEDAKKYGE